MSNFRAVLELEVSPNIAALTRLKVVVFDGKLVNGKTLRGEKSGRLSTVSGNFYRAYGSFAPLTL